MIPHFFLEYDHPTEEELDASLHLSAWRGMWLDTPYQCWLKKRSEGYRPPMPGTEWLYPKEQARFILRSPKFGGFGFRIVGKMGYPEKNLSTSRAPGDGQ